MFDATSVTLPYPPSANRYWRIAGNRLYPSAEALAFKRAVGLMARAKGIRQASGPMSVGITLHPRLTKRGAESKTRLDLDNALKVTLDALNGIAWLDDSQVVVIHAVVGAGVADGGITVEVAPCPD